MDDDARDITPLPEDFRQSAAPPLPVESVTLPIDTDVVAWLRSESADWQSQVNGLLRFYMDTTMARAASFDPDAFDPGELVQDPPHLEYEFG